MRLLVSVRDADEALLAAGAGADFIDCKEPHAGALGALPPAATRAVVAALRERHPGLPVSATIGDLFSAGEVAAVLDKVAATAACGVDYVKVGIVPGAAGLLEALAGCEAAVVPVFIADQALDDALLARACTAPFPALMLDTADKRRSLFDVQDEAALRRFVLRVRAAGKLGGLAGALRAEHLPRLAALRPDFAGFRSAVCEGARTGALSAARLRALRAALRQAYLPSPFRRAASTISIQ